MTHDNWLHLNEYAVRTDAIEYVDFLGQIVHLRSGQLIHLDQDDTTSLDALRTLTHRPHEAEVVDEGGKEGA